MSNSENLISKLRSIPKSKVLALLQSKLSDEQLVLDVSQRLGMDIATNELGGGQVSHNVLVDIVATSDLVSPDDILELYERWRYRGMKTIYLHRYDRAHREQIDVALAQDDISSPLSDALNTYLQETRRVTERYHDFQIREIDRFNVGEEDLWEMVYSYVGQADLIDPETEEAIPHPDLRFGFLWIDRTTPWVAIAAKDEDIATGLIQFLEQYFSTTIARLTIPKEVITSLEPYESVRRVSHEDERGVHKRVGAARLADFPDEVDEVRRRDRTQRRTSSGYNVQLADGTQFALGYDGDKGRIYFQQNLRTSQLREFGVQKISSVCSTLDDYRSQSPEILMPLSVNNILFGSHTETKMAISEIATKLATARKNRQSEISLDITSVNPAKLGRYLRSAVTVNCKDCNELVDIQCAECDSTRFFVNTDGIQCTQCDTYIGTQALCLQGHVNYVESTDELVTWYPTSELYGRVEDAFATASVMPFNRDEEGFLIRGSTLYVFGSVGEKITYLLDDIPEFAEVCSLELPANERDGILNLLAKYRERCSKMTDSNCAGCVDNRVSTHCYLRLFGLYDTRYTPRPHHGHEFGDVSLHVTVDGKSNCAMTILLKSGKPTGNPITINTKLGQEILAQFEQYLDNPLVEILAVAVPQRIEDSFRERLQQKARRAERKILFIGTEQLANVVQYVGRLYEVPLSEL